MQIYDTLTRKKQTLRPLKVGRIGLYVCGMTVYDLCHLGHARVFVVFDMVVRYLRARGLEVTYVRNITDIDDKIIARANELGADFTEVTRKYIDAMNRDTEMLGVLAPDVEPRASQHIDAIIAMTQTLLDKQLAYLADNGDVCYQVRKFANYGALSGKSIDDLRAGARVAADEGKQDALDFVLWKSAKPGEPSWPSPWGAGRPGWHIECSAMSTECLGNHFDIHAGGADLQFPHHENEIAQSEAATGEKFANLWMHNGHVRIGDEKMSKSLGNFLTIREMLERDENPARAGEVIRFFLLRSHYRSPLIYTDAALEDARKGLTRIYLTLSKVDAADIAVDTTWSAKFHECMQDDFNTPEAVAVLFDLVREINRALDSGDAAQAGELACELRALAATLGLLRLAPAAFLGQSEGDGAAREAIERLIAERAAARAAGDFAAADRIRDELESRGIAIEDGADGTKWHKTR